MINVMGIIILMFSSLGKKLSRQHFEIFFLFFSRNEIWPFMQIRRQFAWKVQSLFLRKNIINLSSAEFAHNKLSVKSRLNKIILLFNIIYNQGPVVQRIFSLTRLLVVKMLTVLVSRISNSQVFLLKKCEQLLHMQKLLTFLQQKY